jgi:protein tyrosine/serine phosphatase
MLWVGYFLLYGNFHKVDNGVYRSAQLFSFNMPYYLEKYHIKSMLNLRGPSDAKWYHDEIDICQEHHVKHYDYGIGDREVSSEKQMDEIIRLIKQAPKPLLIHCKAGADRTSLSSALYLYAIKNDRDASRAISIIYGHFPWFGSRTKAMDKSFKNYVKSHPKVKK